MKYRLWPLERILERSVMQEGGCRLWRGYVGKNGYAYISVDGEKQLAHRVVWAVANGKEPGGLTVDHQCHTLDCVGGPACLHRRCVEPSHLLAMPISENLLRSNTAARRNALKTECLRGHVYTEESVYRSKKGHRYCRVCWSMRAKAYRGNP